MLQFLPDGTLVPVVYDFKRASVTPILGKGETQLMFFSSDDDTKAMTVRLNDNGTFVLYRYMVCCFFDIPCVEAARIMCISLSLLKRIRSWARLDCWPCSLIHSGEHPQFTRDWVVHRRDEIIASLERKFLEQPNGVLGLTVGILKNVRQYAASYLRLVIPGVGRRNVASGVKKIFVEESDDKKLKIKVKLRKLGKKGKAVKELMESMRPRQAIEKRARVTIGSGVAFGAKVGAKAEAKVEAKVEIIETKIEIPHETTMQTASTGVQITPTPPEEWIFIPSFPVCQEFNVFYANDVEDELGLGPVIPVDGMC